MPTVSLAETSTDIPRLIQKRGAAYQECRTGHEAANYEKDYRENNSSCLLSDELEEELEREGWCERPKFNHEKEHKFVRCESTSLVSVFIEIDKKKDRPETSSLEAKWILTLYNGTDDSNQHDNNGFISFSCNDVDGAKSILSVTDKHSDVRGLPFVSELKIDYDIKTSSPYILPTQSASKTIVFNGDNTLQILRWVHDSVEDFQSVDFIAREKESGNQLYLMINNSTVQYGEDGPAAKRWAAHMHSMCQSFARRAEK